MTEDRSLKFSLYFLVAVLIFIISLSFYSLYLSFSNDSFCEQNGYDSAGDQRKVEEGYVACCKIEYVNHYGEEICEAVKK